MTAPWAALPEDVEAPDALTGDLLPEDEADALEHIGAARTRWPDDERLAVLEGRLLDALA